MSNLRNRVAVPLGIMLALIMIATIYLLENVKIQLLVFSTYVGLITPPFQFYEVAWLLATLDQVLNLTILSSLLLWTGIIIIGVLVHRQVSNTLKTMASAVLIPGGAWLLFAIKFAPFGYFHPFLLWTFITWRLFVPSTFFLGGAALLSLPFWFVSRQRAHTIEGSTLIRFVCSQCGSEYGSKPAICVHCGNEGTIHKYH